MGGWPTRRKSRGFLHVTPCWTPTAWCLLPPGANSSSPVMEAPALNAQFAHQLKVGVHGFERGLQGVLICVPGPGLGGGAKGVAAITLKAVPERHTETQPEEVTSVCAIQQRTTYLGERNCNQPAPHHTSCKSFTCTASMDAACWLG